MILLWTIIAQKSGNNCNIQVITILKYLDNLAIKTVFRLLYISLAHYTSMIYTQFYGCTKYQIGRIFSLCSRPDTEFDNSLEIEHTDKPDISDRILDVYKTLSISIVDIFAAQRNVAPSTFIIPPNVLLPSLLQNLLF